MNSNVIEKCLEAGDKNQREILIGDILAETPMYS